MQTRQIPVEATLRYKSYEPAGASSGSPPKLRVIIPLSIALVAGTGGIYGASNISYGSFIFQNPMIEVRGQQPKREYLMSIAQQVTMIRDALGLKMSEVAQVFGVTRPTAYAWLNGSEPKPEVKIRINGVRRLVSDLHDIGVKRIELFARLPLANGRSLIDSLKADTGLEEVVSAIKRTALQPASADSAEMEHGRANRKRIVSLDEISIPILG